MRRKRIHGHRRRKSYCKPSPLKHVISMKKEDQHDHPHKEEKRKEKTRSEAVVDPKKAENAIAKEMANKAIKEDDARTKKENFKSFYLEQITPNYFYEGQKKATNILDYTGVTEAVTGDKNYNKKRFGKQGGYKGDSV